MVSWQIGAHGVGQLARIVHADGRDHRLVIQVLAELDVLFEQPGDAAGERFQLRARLHLEVERADYGAEKAFVVGDRNHLGALHAFDQHLDIAIGQLQALHDVDDAADAEDFVGLGFVDGGVVLGGKERSFCRPPWRLRARARSIRGPPRTGSSCTER
jgi:hypothetical protein